MGNRINVKIILEKVIEQIATDFYEVMKTDRQEFLEDLNNLWDDNACSYCDCEDKIMKYLKKWEKRSEKE